MSPIERPTAAPIRLQAQLKRRDFALDVDLSLPGRGITALFGASGSGKTTCLRVLAGLEPNVHALVQASGEIWQDSTHQRFVPVHQRSVGYVFQEASLFAHLSVEQNLRFGYDRTPKAQRRIDWQQGLELLGISHLLKHHPAELSGGERQRVAIARALASSPRVLLMDEPLAALDSPRKAEILPWLERLHGVLDIPVVYVTHSVDEVARLADHVVVLDAGKVKAEGSVFDITTRLELPLSQGDQAGAVIEAVAGRCESTEQLCLLEVPGGAQLLVPRNPSRELAIGSQVRVCLMARDISISLEQPRMTSVLNVLPAKVVQVSAPHQGQHLVALDISQKETQASVILSRISQVSADRLGLQPGVPVFAQIKGVAIVR